MKTCPKCNKAVSNNSVFCEYCGSRLLITKGSTPTKSLCGSCGHTIVYGAKFCEFCGAPLFEAEFVSCEPRDKDGSICKSERKPAEEAVRLEAELKAAEEAARLEAERKAAEEAARLEAERKAAEEAARLEAERKAAEDTARLEAEHKAAEDAARLEAKQKAAKETTKSEVENNCEERKTVNMFAQQTSKKNKLIWVTVIVIVIVIGTVFSGIFKNTTDEKDISAQEKGENIEDCVKENNVTVEEQAADDAEAVTGEENFTAETKPQAKEQSKDEENTANSVPSANQNSETKSNATKTSYPISFYENTAEGDCSTKSPIQPIGATYVETTDNVLLTVYLASDSKLAGGFARIQARSSSSSESAWAEATIHDGDTKVDLKIPKSKISSSTGMMIRLYSFVGEGTFNRYWNAKGYDTIKALAQTSNASTTESSTQSSNATTVGTTSSISLGNAEINAYLVSLKPQKHYEVSRSVGSRLYHFIYTDLSTYEQICAYLSQRTDLLVKSGKEFTMSDAIEVTMVRIELCKNTYSVEKFFGDGTMIFQDFELK